MTDRVSAANLGSIPGMRGMNFRTNISGFACVSEL